MKIHKKPARSMAPNAEWSHTTMHTVEDTGSTLASILPFTAPISFTPVRYSVKAMAVPSKMIAARAARPLPSNGTVWFQKRVPSPKTIPPMSKLISN